MLSVSSRIRSTLLAAAATLVASSAGATVVTYVGTQAPNLNIPSPPTTLSNSIQAQMGLFVAQSTILGGSGFETLVNPAQPLGAVEKSFSYPTGNAANPTGTATFTGSSSCSLTGISSGTVWASDQKNECGKDYTPTGGRYNMTGYDTSPQSPPAIGHWLESTSTFSFTFQPGVSALSFFVTDLGDIDLDTIVYARLYDSQGLLLKEERLRNTESIEVLDAQGNRSTTTNGNLLYFGATNDSGDFGKLEFSIQQSQANLDGEDYDWIGFDELKVGQYRPPATGGSVPEPASLALVGMALAAGALARRRAAR